MQYNPPQPQKPAYATIPTTSHRPATLQTIQTHRRATSTITALTLVARRCFIHIPRGMDLMTGAFTHIWRRTILLSSFDARISCRLSRSWRSLSTFGDGREISPTTVVNVVGHAAGPTGSLRPLRPSGCRRVATQRSHWVRVFDFTRFVVGFVGYDRAILHIIDFDLVLMSRSHGVQCLRCSLLLLCLRLTKFFCRRHELLFDATKILTSIIGYSVIRGHVGWRSQ